MGGLATDVPNWNSSLGFIRSLGPVVSGRESGRLVSRLWKFLPGFLVRTHAFGFQAVPDDLSRGGDDNVCIWEGWTGSGNHYLKFWFDCKHFPDLCSGWVG